MGADAPEDDFRFFENVAVIGGRLKTGGGSDGAINVVRRAAAATHDVMVIVSDPPFIASRMTGKLNAPHQPRFHQHIEIVIDGLRGKCPQSLTRRGGDFGHVGVSPFLLHGMKHGKPRGGHAKPRQAEALSEGSFVSHQ
jgi:hypothetical protein